MARSAEPAGCVGEVHRVGGREKDIAQALCPDLGGKNQDLADCINRHLDKSPALQRDEWFKRLFAARMKKESDPKKQKEPTLAAPGGGQDEGDDAVPPSKKPCLH